jgi:hypothetical protein
MRTPPFGAADSERKSVIATRSRVRPLLLNCRKLCRWESVKLRLGYVLFASATLVGCATEPPQAQSQMVWLRLDGQRGTGNPALTQKFETDRANCFGKAHDQVDAVSCMAQKGYIQVPADQAEASNRALAAANAPK